MSKIKYLVAFGAGVIAGSFVTWKLVKDTYEQQHKEDMDSLRRLMIEKHLVDTEDIEEDDESDEIVVPTTVVAEKPDLMEYATKLRECGYGEDGYIDYTKMSHDGDELEDDVNEVLEDEPTSDEVPLEKRSDKPYTITPNEFGEFDDYEKISLTYFGEDGILTDENDEIIDDPDGVIGMESLIHFGVFEDDTVFVRNDALKCDYEVCWDKRRYADVVMTKPYIMEG